MNEYTVIDADGHLFETAALRDYLEPRWNRSLVEDVPPREDIARQGLRDPLGRQVAVRHVEHARTVLSLARPPGSLSRTTASRPSRRE